MLKINPKKIIAFCFSAVLLLLFAVLTAPVAPRAGEKTPPYYPEKGKAQTAKPDRPDPAKDFSALFPSSHSSGTNKQTPPYYDKGKKKARTPAPKAKAQAPAGQRPAIDEKEFRTQEYVVQEGDWLAKILREKGLVKDENLPELLSMLRKLNASMHDLDMIQPGEKIIILVKVVPDGESEKKALPLKKEPPPLEKQTPSLKEETFQRPSYETYKMKRGDSLIRLAMARYQLSDVQFNREYLKLFKACNPSVHDPNRLLVGQVINLPHYPPEHVETAKMAPVTRDLEKSPHRVALTPPSRSKALQLSKKTPPALPEPTPTPPVSAKARPKPAVKDGSPSKEPVWPAHLKPVTAARVDTGVRPETTSTPPVSAKARPKPAVKDVPPSPEPVWPAHLKPVTAAEVDGAVVSERISPRTTVIITDGLGTVIAEMGEEWVHSGEHVLPMKSGGHINLKADSYPMVRLHQGITVIVDMHNALPEKMAKVLESNWANYRVVRLSPHDDLRSALDKILSAFNYPKILKGGEPLKLSGNIPVSITADWIVTPPQTDSDQGPRFVVINLLDDRGLGLPKAIKDYLKLIGVEVIEYPAAEEGTSQAGALSTAQTATDPAALIKAVLDLRGIPFTTQVDIPAYASQNKDFKFTVQADYYLEIRRQRYIIDVAGMGPDLISLLKENGFSVLSLAQEEEPVEMVSKILELLNVRFERGPHSFAASRGDLSKNVKLTLSGVTFYDRKGSSVLATPIDLPPEIVAFLSQRGYRVLVLSPFGPSGSGSA